MKYLLCFILGVVATVSINSFAKVENVKQLPAPERFEFKAVAVNSNGAPSSVASSIQSASNSAGNSGFYFKEAVNSFAITGGHNGARQEVLYLIFEKKKP